LSVVMPCLNEEENIGRWVSDALDMMARHRVDGEVVVADNCSEDRSAATATEAEAPYPGQGRPLRHACASSSVLPALDQGATGMEFASEMVIRAANQRLEIRQMPIRYHLRGGGVEALDLPRRLVPLPARPQPDGLFIVPGVVMTTPGALATLTVVARFDLLARTWDVHLMIAGALLVIGGTQVVALGICAEAYGTYFMLSILGLRREDR
jgi:hypothetical protein